MAGFDDYAQLMDGPVEEHLGDPIEYQRDAPWAGPTGLVAAGAWAAVPGFILNVDASTDDIDDLDELRQRKRLKIRMAVIDRPRPSDRVRSPKLGATIHRPMASFDTDGRYWVSDLEETA